MLPLERRSSNVKRFGTFEVDLRARELRKGGIRIRLQDQPFEILAVMLERPGDVVTREELRAAPVAGGDVRRFRAQPERGDQAAARRARRRRRQSAVRRDAASARLPLHRGGREPKGSRCAICTSCRPPARSRRPTAANVRLVVLPFANLEQRSDAGIFQRRADRGNDHADRPAVPGPARRHRAHVVDAVQAVGEERQRDRPRAVRRLSARRQRARRRRSHPHHRAAHRDAHRSAPLGRDLRPVARRDAESADRRRRAHRALARDGAGARSGRRAGTSDAAPHRGISGVSERALSLESRRHSKA